MSLPLASSSSGAKSLKPVEGSYIFKALYHEKTIVMACNTRIVIGVVPGILKAAKKMDAPVILELAKSESDLSGGYVGLTPYTYAERLQKIANEVGHDIWALHADHLTVKKNDAQTIQVVKDLIAGQVNAGFTSFAIDGSFLFNDQAEDVAGQMADNIKVTIEIAKFIEQNYVKRNGKATFGLEVEVGEIGKKNEQGRVLTTPEEALVFVKALQAAKVFPHVFGIANGSQHGNTYDKAGNIVAQTSIDIPQTIKVARALHDAGLGVRLAQHGITGTPLEIIKDKFPHGELLKGNVGTFWMNLVWEVLQQEKPAFYDEIYNWTLTTYAEAAKKKNMTNPVQIFGTYGKNAIKQFFDKIYGLDPVTVAKIERKAYEEALMFFDAFRSQGMAKKVRGYIAKNAK